MTYEKEGYDLLESANKVPDKMFRKIHFRDTNRLCYALGDFFSNFLFVFYDKNLFKSFKNKSLLPGEEKSLTTNADSVKAATQR
jgi:hypothetical protein